MREESVLDRLWYSFHFWLVYGRHGAAYRRSVRRMERRYKRAKKAAGNLHAHSLYAYGQLDGGDK